MKQARTIIETGVSGVVMVPLAADTKKRMPRPRAGFDKIAKLLAAEVRANPALIAMDGIDLDQLDSDLAGVDTLDLVCQTLAEQLALVEGTRFLQQSRSWMQTLIIYERIRSTGRTNEKLAFLVQTVTAFMRKKKRTESPAAAAPPASTPSA